jgi:hypothetical protein
MSEWVTPPALRLETYVLPDSPNLLASTPLLRAGWKITLAEGIRGSQIKVPGITRPFPLTRDVHGSVIVTFVETPRGLLLRDDSVAHRCLAAHEFILDTGAEVCLIGPGSIALLSSMGSVPPMTVTGVGGMRTFPMDSGLLVVEPPHGARVPPPDGSAPPHSDHGPDGPALRFASLCARAFDDEGVFFDGELAVDATFDTGFPLPPSAQPAAVVRKESTGVFANPLMVALIVIATLSVVANILLGILLVAR